MILQKGENTYLRHTNDVRIKLYWENNPASPLCLFLDNESNIQKVLSGKEQDSFIPVIHLGEHHIQYDINLNELPDAITKILFVSVIEGVQPAQKVGISIENRDTICFELVEIFRGHSLIIGEVYRYQDGWKVRAVGEAIKGGKKQLLQLYQSSNPEVTNELPKAHPKIVTVIDSSIHAMDLFESGKLQKLFKELFIASSIINPSWDMDVYFYAVLHKREEKATKHNFQRYIETYYPKPAYFNGLGLENHELPLLDDLLEEYKESETIFYFITNGDIPRIESFFERIKRSSPNGFWEIIILNEEIEVDTKYNSRNVKILPYQTLSELEKGDLHQTILRPINSWRNNKC